MDREANPIPSSPSISSVSSSDLDTESTGSFFPDRSTTLGTLMGVTFPEVPAGPVIPPSRRDRATGGGGRAAAERRRRRGHRRGRSWWRLCRDDMGPTSLGDFLQLERRLSDGDLYGGRSTAEHEAVGGGPLFEDGRVLPPPPPRRGQQRAAVVGARLPVLLTGICSGGEG